MSNIKVDFSEIEVYLFDLGGVLIDIDPLKTIEAFSQLGLSQLHDQINHGHHSGLFKQLETGQISDDDFISAIRKQLRYPYPISDVIDAWNKMLIHFPVERIQILKQLKKEKPVYLLSNTNGIHRDYFTKMTTQHSEFEDLFTQVFYSYQLGCSKPDSEPFLKVIQETGLKPERTLFLDDSLANLATAKKIGFQTYFITKENTVEKIFSNM